MRAQVKEFQVVIEISENRTVLGSEFPHCDQIQLMMIILFFMVWAIDSLSFFIFKYSTARAHMKKRISSGYWERNIYNIKNVFQNGFLA